MHNEHCTDWKNETRIPSLGIPWEYPRHEKKTGDIKVVLAFQDVSDVLCAEDGAEVVCLLVLLVELWNVDHSQGLTC